MSSVTLGGDRLGAGNKQKVSLRNYERSTHDLGYVWRSTMASGTLVPFMSQVALPGDTFDIDLDVDIMTHPTIGPLFGSYKVQLDVFYCPLRLYHGKLHMNMLNIGLNMAQIKLPLLKMETYNDTIKTDNTQINPSSLFKYLGISGLGNQTTGTTISRGFNAIPYLAYWDIYKQYYSNKSEEIGAYIHNPMNTVTNNIAGNITVNDGIGNGITVTTTANSTSITTTAAGTATFIMVLDYEPDYNQVFLYIGNTGGPYLPVAINELYSDIVFDRITKTVICKEPTEEILGEKIISRYRYNGGVINPNLVKPQVTTFDLANIDQMREDILTWTANGAPFEITKDTYAPYGPPLAKGNFNDSAYSARSTQEGLGLKTYQSDLFNNWVSTEWIDGPNGINEITAVDTTSGQFTIDTLQLSRKVYDMLNRIAVSGGTYDDWLDAVYTHERTRSVENPIYMGGLIKELAFQEVVSNASAGTGEDAQPLGTLAGRGKLTDKHKGGKIRVKSDEVGYVIGIISLTPRVDYSQGNTFDVNLSTMDDFHKPALDEIGFQGLISEQMAWWDTTINASTGKPTYKEVGKQPAWINYMTNVNKCFGNFAEENQQMFMTLNRRYERGTSGIKDLTTYIDPSKFNNIFADTRLDAQNFWAQIAVNITARRKMSAKLMPNL